MSTIEHSIQHFYQPTNHSCSHASLAMLLSHFGENVDLTQLMNKVPVIKGDDGEEWGTINQQLATWCLSLGFDVTMYTADFQVIDLEWANLSGDALQERMRLAQQTRNVPALGTTWSKIYLQSYLDFLDGGGQLHIIPFMTSRLIDQLLPQGPLLLCISYNVLYNSGRSTDVALRRMAADDINGKTINHSIVLYGKNEQQQYLIADPWQEPGFHTVEPERLLAAMTAAQVECDNLLFQLTKAGGSRADRRSP